jgi:hypothetical protein
LTIVSMDLHDLWTSARSDKIGGLVPPTVAMISRMPEEADRRHSDMLFECDKIR